VALVIDEFFLRSPFTNTNHNISPEGEDCAKNKDQPRSSKAIQKDRDRKDQSQEGFRAAYPDEEIVQ
jgi:hypothetical protein